MFVFALFQKLEILFLNGVLIVPLLLVMQLDFRVNCYLTLKTRKIFIWQNAFMAY